jgi:hypothetical protein
MTYRAFLNPTRLASTSMCASFSLRGNGARAGAKPWRSGEVRCQGPANRRRPAAAGAALASTPTSRSMVGDTSVSRWSRIGQDSRKSSLALGSAAQFLVLLWLRIGARAWMAAALPPGIPSAAKRHEARCVPCLQVTRRPLMEQGLRYDDLGSKLTKTRCPLKMLQSRKERVCSFGLGPI